MPNAWGSFAYATEEWAGPPVPNSPYVSTNGGLFPTRFLEIAPGYGPNDASPVWVNIASDVTQIAVRRGRQRILSRFEAGTMAVTVDNKSGRYSPFNSSSPYYNLIAPGMPIRFRAIWGAITYTEFSGFVESWPLVWPSAADSQVTITAVDAMKFLNLKKATAINTYSQTITGDGPIAWYRLNDAIGSTTAVDSSGNGRTLSKRDYNDVFPALPKVLSYYFQNDGALIADTDASLYAGHKELCFTNMANQYAIPIPGAISIECWVKASGENGGSFVVVSTSGATPAKLVVGAATDGNATFYVSGYTSPTVTTSVPVCDDRWHHLVGTITADANEILTIYVDGQQYGQVTATGFSDGANNWIQHRIAGSQGVVDVQFGLDGAIDEAAVYNKVLTPAQVLAHYNAGAYPRQLERTGQRIGYIAGYSSIPTSMQVLDTGQSTVQGATNKWLTSTILANMQDQADTEDGALFIDGAGRLTFFDRLHISRSPYSQVSLVLGDSVLGNAVSLRLPGTSGNYVSTPDSVVTSITGDIDLRAKVALTSWNTGTAQDLVSKWNATGNQKSYILQVTSTGALSLIWSNDGAATLLDATASPLGYAAGTTKWVRATIDVDNGAAGRTVAFYDSNDGVTWNLLQSAATAGVTSIFNSTAEVEIGALVSSGRYVAGDIYYSEIRNGIGGTVIAKFDPATVQPSTATAPNTVTSTTGETWTVNGAAWSWITGTPEEPYRLESLTVSYDDQDVYNEITITPENLAPQTASDTTSQTQYGKRTQASSSLTSTVADAAARAAARLALFKTPLPRVDSITVVPADDPTMLFGPVLGFDLLTRIEVRRRPKDGAGSTFDQTALIEGIEHRVGKATWETTWRLGIPS